MRVPSLQSMIDLYGLSMELTLEAQRFQIQVEELKRLALNSEVLAVRSGTQGEVFQTIAREIGRLSAQVTEVITALIKSVQSVGDKAIHSAATARLCERYKSALDRGIEGKTLTDVQDRYNDIGNGMVQDLDAIYHALIEASKTLQDISRLQVQLPMIATLLNIEANRDVNTDQAVGANAKHLLQLKQNLSELLELVIEKTSRTLTFLSNLFSSTH